MAKKTKRKPPLFIRAMADLVNGTNKVLKSKKEAAVKKCVKKAIKKAVKKSTKKASKGKR